jgi:hypothetical protein
MTHPSGTILRALLVGAVLGYAPVEELGVSGNVSAPDGTPLSRGSVVMQSQGGGRTTSSIDDAGRFRVIPNVPGVRPPSYCTCPLPFRRRETVSGFGTTPLQAIDIADQ